jgi:hypothetical protein
VEGKAGHVLTYVQSTGELCGPDGSCLAIGFSGDGELRNRGEHERVRLLGPIPRGSYSIQALRRFNLQMFRLKPKVNVRNQPYFLQSSGRSQGCINVAPEVIPVIGGLVTAGENLLEVK